MTMESLSKNQKITIIVAIIGGVFLLGNTLLQSWMSKEPEGKLKIININLLDSADISGIEILIHNQSGHELPINSIELRSRKNGVLNAIGSSKYVLEDLAIFLSSNGNITGKVKRDKAGINRKIKGKIKFQASGGWDFSINLDVRESLKAGETRSLIIFLPNTIKVLSPGSKEEKLGYGSDYFIGIPKQFQFTQFFEEQVDNIEVTATSSNGEVKLTKSIK
jgi:hypothetical protein